MKRSTIPIPVYVMAGVHALAYSVVCAGKYTHGLYDDFDLAIFTQAVDQIRHGSVYSSIRGMPWIGDHASLILFLMAPIHAVVSSPLTLLVLQSAALGAGAIPVYALASRELQSRNAGIAFAVAYLLYPAVGYINLFEFHPEALAVAPLLFAMNALRQGRISALAAWSGLALLAREDVALVVLMMAGYALATRAPRARETAVTLAVLGVASLGITFLWLRPAFAGLQAEYGLMYASWGDSPLGIIRGVITDPIRALTSLVYTAGHPADALLKQQYWLHLLAPVAFLSLISPTTFLIAAPVIALHMLSDRAPQHTIVFQYAALVVPFAVASAVIGLRNAVQKRAGSQRIMLGGIIGLLACTGVSQIMFGPIISFGATQTMGRPQRNTPTAAERLIEPYWKRMLTQIPSDGGVVASFRFLPHVADRANAHSAHHLMSGTYTFSRTPYPTPTGIDGVIVDLASPGLQYTVNATTARRWWDLLSRNGLSPTDAVEDIVLLLKGPPKADLCAVVEDAPRRNVRATFGGSVELLGCDPPLVPIRSGELLGIRTYWSRHGTVDGPRLSEIVLMNEAGVVVERRVRHLGYTIFPAHEWPEGAVVRETYQLLLGEGVESGRHRILVKLWTGVGGRELRAVPESTENGFVELGWVQVVSEGYEGG